VKTSEATFNPASLDSWTSVDVDAAFARLRSEEPIAFHEHPDSGRGFWSVTRHEDISRINPDFESFSSAAGSRVAHDPEMDLLRPASDSFVETDPPTHTSMRKIVSKGFTPRGIKRFEDIIRDRVRDVVSGIPTSGTFDFVRAAAAPLPLHVIGDIVGVPEADRDYLFELTNRSFGDGDTAYDASPEDGSKAVEELRAYGLDLARQRRADPRDDLTTTLVATDVDGRPLSPTEMGAFLALLIGAGNETTRNALSLGMKGFSDFPEQRVALLNEEPRNVADEVLRWATPLMGIRREVRKTAHIGGVQMDPGDKVVLWYRSSNRDESVFPDPLRFDVSRDASRHQAFGGGGPHYCLGSNLAKVEIQVFFEELFKAHPDIRVVSEPALVRSNQFRAVREMQTTCVKGDL